MDVDCLKEVADSCVGYLLATFSPTFLICHRSTDSVAFDVKTLMLSNQKCGYGGYCGVSKFFVQLFSIAS